MAAGGSTLTRDQKVENLILNYSMIVMSTFEDMFADLAAKMADGLAQGTQAMAEAMTTAMTGSSQEPKAKGKKARTDIGPKVSTEVKNAFAQLRAEARSQLKMNEESFRKFVSNPALDGGIGIVEKFDFGLPRITAQLSDQDFASYMLLIRKGDPKVSKMLEELGEWQKGVPKPWKE